jgi:hypothetical protein
MTGSPRWSPDGRSLAFDSRGRGRADIYVVNLDSGESVRITDPPQPMQITSSPAGLVTEVLSTSAPIGPGIGKSGDTLLTPVLTFRSRPRAALTQSRHRMASLFSMWRTWGVPGFGGYLSIAHKMTLPGMWHAWTVSWDSLFYLKRSSSSASATLFRLDLRSGKTQALGQAAQAVNDRISTSSDDRWVLFGRRSNTNSSIMILDGWN